MHNIRDIMVEIEGELFPAVNIQIFDFSPTVGYSEGNTFFPYTQKSEEGEEGKKDWYGIYFEIMFESGANLAVYQEMASTLNGECTTQCSELGPGEFQQHFFVELTHVRDRYKEVIHAWHCSNEDELLSVLRTTKANLGSPGKFPEEDAA